MSAALDFDRRLLVLPGIVLVLAALLGYLLGRRSAPSATREATLTASAAGVLLQAPAHWRSTSASEQIPGLSLRNAVALAPGGDPAGAGLLAGALPAGQPGPLPSAFTTRLRGQPNTSVVSLQEAQAYRYTNLSLAGFTDSLVLYVVPNPGGAPTALACYASAAQAAELEACQRIVATLTLAGRTQSYDLTPQPEYAQRLSAAISPLTATRSTLRAQMSTNASPELLQRDAAKLERAFAAAATSLSGLETTLATGQAQAALSGAILQARTAYTALSSAAAGRSQAAYVQARSQVQRAEAGVNAGLEDFALLGYKPA